MHEHGVAPCALLVNQVLRLLFYDLILNSVQQGDLGLLLEIVVSPLLLLDEMPVCLSQILRAVETHKPVLPFLCILLLDPGYKRLLELIDVVIFVVLLPLPDELIVLLDDVGCDEANLNESVDRPLDQVQVDHLIVAVLRHLVQDRSPHAVYHLEEALIAEQVQCRGGKTHRVVVFEVIPVLQRSN